MKITACNIQPGGTSATLTWNSVATRFYCVQDNLDLATTNWADSGLGFLPPTGNSTTGSFSETNAPRRFYRVQAARPLLP